MLPILSAQCPSILESGRYVRIESAAVYTTQHPGVSEPHDRKNTARQACRGLCVTQARLYSGQALHAPTCIPACICVA